MTIGRAERGLGGGKEKEEDEAEEEEVGERAEGGREGGREREIIDKTNRSKKEKRMYAGRLETARNKVTRLITTCYYPTNDCVYDIFTKERLGYCNWP